MTSGPETRLQRLIQEHLRAAFPADLRVRKNHEDAYTVRGTPDLTGALEGVAFEIEVKSPDTDHPVSEIQKYRLRDYAAAGVRTGVAESVEDAIIIATGDFEGAGEGTVYGLAFK